MKFHRKRLESSTRNPESMEWDPESTTALYSLTWGDSTGLWTANYYFSFIYLPLIRSPHLKTFVNEISVRRFLSFTDCFFLLRVVSFCFTLQETVRSPRLLLCRSQLIKKLAHANNKAWKFTRFFPTDKSTRMSGHHYFSPWNLSSMEVWTKWSRANTPKRW